MANLNPGWLSKNITNKQIPSLLINLGELKASKTDCTSLQDYNVIGSYNWSLDSTPVKPTILVPGKPDELNGTLSLCTLSKSKYEQMVDENRFYQPEYPIESLFRCVEICSPSFDFRRQAELVTDRNNLRKLFDFVEGKSKKAFRIDLQCIRGLLVFVRNDEESRMFCDDYGKDFERRFTQEGLNQGAYRRVVAYKFGDVRIVTRFEVDCVEQRGRPVVATAIDLDSLVKSMARVNLEMKSECVKFKDSGLSLIKMGKFDPHEMVSLVELTTKSTFRGQFDFPESKWNQLFFSQTDTLLIGWHQRGSIQKLEKLAFKDVTRRCKRSSEHVAGEAAAINKPTCTALAKLNTLLIELREFAMKPNNEGAVFSIIHEIDCDATKLKVFRCGEKMTKCVPVSIEEMLKK